MRPITPSKQVADFLRSVPVFGGLEGRWLNSVMKVLHTSSFPSGAAIFREGEIGRTMHVLKTGEVEVLQQGGSGRQISVARLGPGECFGEMALVELQPRSATVVVRKKASTYSLTNLDLYTLFRQDNYAYIIVLQNICRLLSRRLRHADGRICNFIEEGRRPRRARLRTKRGRG